MHYFLMNLIEIIFSGLEYICYVFLPVSKYIVHNTLHECGVQINGNRPFDIQVKNDRFYSKNVAKGATGFVDAYAEKYFECDQLDVFLIKLLDSRYGHIGYFHPYRICKYLVHKYFDALDEQSVMKYVNNHYDDYGMTRILPIICDQNAQYSTYLLDNFDQVERASPDELKNIMNEGAIKMRDVNGRKLKLQPGMRVLDIGCGFGGLAKHLAERYKVHVTGITLSKIMAEQARKVCSGLDVDINQIDYRSITGKFDRIICIQMLEHVGENHLNEYFRKIHSLLTDDGLFLLQLSQANHPHIQCYDPFLEENTKMFCYLPRMEEICYLTNGLFIIENVECRSYQFGVTATCWLKNLFTHRDLIVEQFGEKWWRTKCALIAMLSSTSLAGYNRNNEYVFSKNGLRYAYSY